MLMVEIKISREDGTVILQRSAPACSAVHWDAVSAVNSIVDTDKALIKFEYIPTFYRIEV